MLSMVKSIFHPSDLSKDSERAFAHALALALLGKTRFTILHVGGEEDKEAEEAWRRFPGVRQTLVHWGLLEEKSPRSAVFRELQIRVEKIRVRSNRPLDAALRHLEKQPSDLIVLATEGRDGLPRWLRRSMAEPLARRSRTMTLFVPNGARPFVSMDTGDVSLQRVLIPVDRDPVPDAALDVAADAAGMIGGYGIDIQLLHVGRADRRPSIELPTDPGCRWEEIQRDGDVVDAIVDAAAAGDADLIVMATKGRDGFLESWRGSTTEQVLRRAPCPVLAVPEV